MYILYKYVNEYTYAYTYCVYAYVEYIDNIHTIYIPHPSDVRRQTQHYPHLTSIYINILSIIYQPQNFIILTTPEFYNSDNPGIL